MTNEEIRQWLASEAEEGYRSFSARLLPEGVSLLGVRLPKLRRMAKKIAKCDWQGYLAQAADSSFEETMLSGMVIGYAQGTLSELLSAVRRFVPRIDNWSVCDSFCIGLKWVRQDKERVWQFLEPYFTAPEEFAVRFALVMLLDFYIDEADLERSLGAISSVSHPGYYAKMAAAWAVSMLFVRFSERVGRYLEEGALDEWTHRRAVRKIIESRAVSDAVKDDLRHKYGKIRPNP